MAFYSGPRPETEPFFVAKDRVRPYTYSAASSDLRKFVKRVSPQDFAFGLHGIRVRGYNDACEGEDEELAVAHGGWRSSAHTRYARFQLSRVLGLAAAMATVAGAPADAPGTASAEAPAADVADVSDASSEAAGEATAAAAARVSIGSSEAANDALQPHGECEECVDDGAADEEEQPEGGRLSIAQLVMSPISTIAERIADRRGRRP